MNTNIEALHEVLRRGTNRSGLATNDTRGEHMFGGPIDRILFAGEGGRT